ncbi:hypothetical protein NDU88_011690 [Pleurodeles waltl]|uniref:Uncharacterized protein n=1 Tax=Pleurodeles waltl TaxID=8319 RepID=A0AAV7QZB7_PLEWA|nr:hypothetical protein NDU88_011690 [Pleurodeles waltl]
MLRRRRRKSESWIGGIGVSSRVSSALDGLLKITAGEKDELGKTRAPAKAVEERCWKRASDSSVWAEAARGVHRGRRFTSRCSLRGALLERPGFPLRKKLSGSWRRGVGDCTSTSQCMSPVKHRPRGVRAEELEVAILLGIVAVRSGPCCSAGSRGCFTFTGLPEGSRTDSRRKGLRWWSWLQGRGKLRTGWREQVNEMAPKNRRSSRMKIGVGERRPPQSLPLGAASNAGKKSVSKAQGALDNKQLIQIVDAGSGSRIKDVMHHGDGPTIPDMFESPQPIMNPPSLGGRVTISTTLLESQELVECGDSDAGLAHSVSNNSFSQVSADSSECCLNMTATSADLTLTGLYASAPSSNFDGLSAVTGEGENCTPQAPSSVSDPARANAAEKGFSSNKLWGVNKWLKQKLCKVVKVQAACMQTKVQESKAKEN